MAFSPEGAAQLPTARRTLRLTSAVWLVVVAIAFAACGEDDDKTAAPAGDSGLSVVTDIDRVEAGGEIEARVQNDTASDYTYGAAYLIERQIESGYEPVPLPRTPVPEIGLVAPPGEAGPPVPVEIPKDLEAGTYRVTLGPDAEPATFLVG